jgi:programmed cell death protein 5
MSELDEIKKRKLAEMQAAQQGMQSQAREQLEMQQRIAELESVVKQLFTKEALERYGNIKAADPDKAVQVIAVIGQMVQAGRAQVIDDETLKGLLSRLAPPKKEFRINRV